MPFRDRVDAGRRLAPQLMHLRGGDVVVLGLPRGGVPVAAEVARSLDAPLDIIVVRKLGVPFHPELAMGAIGEGGVRVLNDDLVRAARVTAAQLARAEQSERAELERRAGRYRGGRPRIPLAGRTAIVIDDGIATGSTARAACQVARALGAVRVVLATPVAPPSVLHELRRVADDVICLESPAEFQAVGQWYRDFGQTTDEQVVALLDQATTRRTVASTVVPGDVAAARPATDREIEVLAGPVRLPGRLTLPAHSKGLVVFAHGSGSSRHSPRNQFVAEVLNRSGLGTLLFDLLTPDEERDRANVFDIELLGARLVGVTRWLRTQAPIDGMDIAYFGASTGAGAAMWAAAEPGIDVAAVVSRGGRPDLAGTRLTGVRAPTLLIVGGRDDAVLELNRRAAAQLRCEHRVAVVPGATHLFEESGTLRAAAELARDWFVGHLAAEEPAVPEPARLERAATVGTERRAVVACPGCGTRNRVPAVATGTPRCAACHHDLPWLVEARDPDFAAIVDTRLPVLVDLWAPWCGPCRLVASGVEQAARELAGQLKVVKVDVDEAPAVAGRFGVQSVPTLLVLRHGRIVGRQVGALNPDRLLAWVRGTINQHAA
jgi:putative phosphoribosyl transferase